MTTYRVGREFTAYEYTNIEAESFEDALEKASDFGIYWEYEPETHKSIDLEGSTWVRNTETLEDRNY